ncbi:uncharacterized protein HD556DRAFT_1247271, partial [Suillus plorans]
DTKLVDRILLHHLLDLAQAKLATVSGLPKRKNALCVMQSLLWREALASSKTNAERLQTAHTMLNAPGLSLDTATKKIILSHTGMNLVVQKPSEICEMGDNVAHPKSVSKEAYKRIIARHTITENHAGLHAILEYVDPAPQSS